MYISICRRRWRCYQKGPNIAVCLKEGVKCHFCSQSANNSQPSDYFVSKPSPVTRKSIITRNRALSTFIESTVAFLPKTDEYLAVFCIRATHSNLDSADKVIIPSLNRRSVPVNHIALLVCWKAQLQEGNRGVGVIRQYNQVFGRSGLLGARKIIFTRGRFETEEENRLKTTAH